MTIKRYKESEYMDESPEGDYVSFDDYADLEQRCAALKVAFEAVEEETAICGEYVEKLADAHRAMAKLLAALADDPVGLDAQVFSEATCEAILECKVVLERGGADPVEDDR